MKTLISDIRKYEEAMKLEREEEKMNLTENEKLMIENIINNEYDSGLDNVTWVFAVQYSHNEFPKESYKGILGSLVKKNLVEVYEHEKNENVVSLTESGKKVALQLFNKKYNWLSDDHTGEG